MRIEQFWYSISLSAVLFKNNLFLCVVLLSVWTVSLKAQTTKIIPETQYIIDIWEQEDGLPQNSVNNVIQDEDGYLWVATFGGLSRFDGKRFTTYDRNTLEGLINDRILVVQKNGPDKLIIAENHIFIWEKEGVRELANPLDKSSFVDVVGIDVDTYFLKDIHGFSYLLKEGKLQSLPNIINEEVDYWYFTNNENTVIRVGLDGFDKVTSTGFESLGKFAKPLTPSTLRRLFAAFVDVEGNFWYSIEKQFVAKSTQKGWEEYWVKDYPNHNEPYVLTINQDLNGQIWVGTSSGFGYLKDSYIKHVDMNVLGYTGMYVKGFLVDTENNLWFSTRTNGLVRLRKSPVRTFAADAGLIRDSMLSLYEDDKGTFWAGTNCGGLYKRDGDKFVISEFDDKMSNKCIWSILKDRKGRYVFGTFGVEIFDGNKYSYFSSENGLHSNWIYAIIEDAHVDGKLWVGSSDDVFVIHPDMRIERKFLLSNLEVKTFYHRRDGNVLWAGTNKGILKFIDDILDEHIQEINGIQISVRSIYEEPDGTLWFGTYGDGIIRYKNNEYDFIGAQQGVYDMLFSHLVYDDLGFLWVGSNKGIARYELKELNAVADGQKTVVQPLVITRSDGMLSSETNGGFYPSAIKDKNGHIWFPTIRGIVQVDPSQIKRNEIVPKVKIEGIQIGGEATQVDFANELKLAHNAGRIDIQYTSLSLTDASKNKFRYMLEPIEQNWTEGLTERSVTFNKLSPGHYTFKILGSNNDGIWAKEAAVFRFYITPPWFRTYWAYGSYLLLLVGFIGAYLRYRRLEFQIRERVQQELTEELIQTLESERKRIAMEMHDGFGQYISVIRNRAQMGLNDLQNPEAVAYHLREIEESASLTLTDLRKISNNLRPVHLERLGLSDTIEAVMESVKETTRLDVEWIIEPNLDQFLPKGADIHVYRVVQEAVTNVLKHANASELRLHFKKLDNVLRLSIQDNGTGFNTELFAPGNGVVGMKERARLIKAEFSVKSPMGTGTLIELIIPIQDE